MATRRRVGTVAVIDAMLQHSQDQELFVAMSTGAFPWKLVSLGIGQDRVDLALCFRMITTYVCSHLLGAGCPHAAEHTSMCKESANTAIRLEELYISSIKDIQEPPP